MRRWVLVFLLIVMPFQMVWGAAATYCEHEKQGATHFGHHEHKHHGSEQSDHGVAGVHADCGTCHLGNAASIPAVLVLVAAALPTAPVEYLQPRYASCVPPGLERPQRCSASHAVRFGSGAASVSLTS